MNESKFKLICSSINSSAQNGKPQNSPIFCLQIQDCIISIILRKECPMNVSSHIHGLFLLVNSAAAHMLHRLNALLNKHAFIFCSLKIISLLFFSHIRRLALAHSNPRNESILMHVSKKYVLPLSLCLNEPERPTLTAARRPSRLKLEQLTGADGPARSRALLGLEWKCHYHINHGCSRIDHSLCTRIMMAVCLSLRKTIILNAAPFITL